VLLLRRVRTRLAQSRLTETSARLSAFGGEADIRSPQAEYPSEGPAHASGLAMTLLTVGHGILGS
jgi:hypothetical protein